MEQIIQNLNHRWWAMQICMFFMSYFETFLGSISQLDRTYSLNWGWNKVKHRVSLDRIIRSVHGKYNCITVKYWEDSDHI